MKIAIALSGGIDSTTVAKRLLAEGHEVIGLTMQLCPDLSGVTLNARAQASARPGLENHGCAACMAPCACVDGVEAARRLGIPHRLLDFRPEFERWVIEPFVRGFARGLTPNPCALCNRAIKFGLLLDKAREAGAEYLATGHYAGLQRVDNSLRILRATDASKDQTYFLALVPQARFGQVLFPLAGEYKAQVEKYAQQQGLVLEESETSTEICFLREIRYTEFLRSRVPEAFVPGAIVDLSGRVLGEHNGLPQYTLGQRRGLGVAAAHPLFVVRLDPEKNQVVVGQDQDLWTREVLLREVNWPLLMSEENRKVQAMIRYRQSPQPAQLEFAGNGQARLVFDQPVRAVTPGQIAAIYDHDRLLGGGTITAKLGDE